MYMIFSAGIANLPLDRAVPFDTDDLMIMISKYMGFRLCGMSTDTEKKFRLKDMIEKTDIFACKDFSEKYSAFGKIFETRLERFFDTGKASYLYFDLEEQNFLREKVFNASLGLSASVEIYVRGLESFEKVELAHMNRDEGMQIASAMDELKIRDVIRSTESYLLKGAAYRKASDARAQMFGIDKFFKDYPKIKDIKTKDQFKQYKRAMAKKWHPDIAEDSTMSAQVFADLEDMERSTWFQNLEGEEVSNGDSIAVV